MAAVHPIHARRLRRAAEIAVQIGAHVEFLDGAAMRARTLPPRFIAGLLEATGRHPGSREVRHRLAPRCARSAGVALYEGHGSTRSATARWRVCARREARWRADAVVLATNAYTPAIGWLRHTVVPLYDTLFETAPLSDAQWPASGGAAGRASTPRMKVSRIIGRRRAERVVVVRRVCATRTVVSSSGARMYRRYRWIERAFAIASRSWRCRNCAVLGRLDRHDDAHRCR